MGQFQDFIPSRSTLYFLDLYESDNSYIESLPSYLLRLSTSHCILLSTFLNEFTNISRVGRAYMSTYREAIDRIKILTLNVEIEKLKFLNWDNSFTFHELLHKTRQWCSICLATWLHEGRDLYEPFLWTLSDNKSCLIHGVKLQTQCFNCGKKSYFFRNQIYGYCACCGEFLGKGPIAPADNTDLADSEVLNKLVLLSLNFRFFLDFNTLITKQIYIHGSAQKLSEYLGTSADRVRGWKSGHCPPLSKFMDVIEKLDTPIHSLFSVQPFKMETSLIVDTEEKLKGIINEEPTISISRLAKKVGIHHNSIRKKYPDIASLLKSHKSKNQIDSEKLYKVLIKELKNPECSNIEEFRKKYGFYKYVVRKYFPEQYVELLMVYKNKRDSKKKYQSKIKNLTFQEIETILDREIKHEVILSLCAIAKKNGLTAPRIRRLFPEKSRAISQRYKTSLALSAEGNFNQQVEKVISIVSEIHARGEYPSINKVQSYFNSYLSLELNKVRKETLNELGYN